MSIDVFRVTVINTLLFNLSFLALLRLKILATLVCTLVEIVNGVEINSIFDLLFIFLIDSCDCYH